MELKELLANLCAPKNLQDYREAWQIFYDRYVPYIEKKVRQTVYNFDHERLVIQSEYEVEDSLTRVLEILIQDNHKALCGYRNPDKEYMFLSWLATVSRNATMRRLRKFYKKNIVSQSDLPSAEPSIDPDAAVGGQAGIFQESVSVLRAPNPKPRQSERDIHLCMLQLSQEFNEKMLTRLPYLRYMNAAEIRNAARNAKHRGVKKLRNHFSERGSR